LAGISATNQGAGQVPFRKDVGDGFFLSLADDDEHPLLRFGKHDLVGGHARLALGDEGEVDLDAAVAPAGCFAGRAGQAGRAHVLHADDGFGVLEQFEAGLKEKLLDERIADLDGGAVGL
jgi:hypothetical protein